MEFKPSFNDDPADPPSDATLTILCNLIQKNIDPQKAAERLEELEQQNDAERAARSGSGAKKP